MNTIKRGGRPSKNPGEKRKYTISVKLDTREYISLDIKSRLAGVNRSEYIRQSISKSTVRPRLTPRLNDHIRELSGMGNNLNQIARKANVAGYASARSEYLHLAEEIDILIDKIRNDS